jgi:hypothetical protein
MVGRLSESRFRAVARPQRLFREVANQRRLSSPPSDEAGSCRRKWLERYSHIRMTAKRNAAAGVALRPKAKEPVKFGRWSLSRSLQ